jgi:hypothetical protein
MTRSKIHVAEFESLGLAEVRRSLSSGMWSEAKLREAREWITDEENRIARSAKNAAWIAVAAAIVSATAAAAGNRLLQC